MANLVLENGNTWNTTGVYDATLSQAQSDINGSIIYLPGTYSLTNTPCSGVITGGANNAELYIHVPKLIVSGTVGISALTAALRTISGSYVGGAQNTNILSYIGTPTYVGNIIKVVATKSSGWGITNNTPICGTVTITFTLS